MSEVGASNIRAAAAHESRRIFFDFYLNVYIHVYFIYGHLVDI